MSLRVKPDTFNETLAPGDIVRVKLDRVASTGASSVHDYLYEVDQIGKSVTGEVQLELTEFPVDADRRSVVAQEVAAAVGQGILLDTAKSGVTCDVNSSGDTSVPADTSIGGWSATGTDANGDPYTVDWDNGGDEFEAGTDSDGDGEANSTGITALSPSRTGWSGRTDNPKTSTSTPSITGATGAGGITNVGDELGFTLGCEGGWTEWRLVDDATGQYTIVSSGVAATYIVAETAAKAGKSILAVGKCPDESAPGGYGPEIISAPVQVKPPGSEFGEGTIATGLNSITGLSSTFNPGSQSQWTNFELVSVGIVGGFSNDTNPLTGLPTTFRNQIVWNRTIGGNPSQGSARIFPGYVWVTEAISGDGSISFAAAYDAL